MGTRGPAPKPPILKLLDGNRGRRPINLADGVNPAVEVPSIPKHLGREARKEWKRITPRLLELGLISQIDRAALALYCQAYGRMVELDTAQGRRIDKLIERGIDYYDAVEATSIMSLPSGYKQASALVSLIKSHREECLKYLAQFGLSPSARARVTPSNNQLSLPGIEGKPGWGTFKSA
jgi:phage terminase, small subunit, putative, P27 family